MAYEIRYHPEVADDDLPKLPANMRERIARAIETRLTTEPERYGAALRGTLRGHRKLRVGDYRVVFKVTANEVLVLAVMHRRRVYEDVEERVD